MTTLVSESWAQSPPCLAGWNYRVPVTVTGSAAAGVQMAVTVNTSNLIVNGKMQLDGGDVRFLDPSGSVIPHWIETGTFNSSLTTIWVKLQSSSSIIYFFYGNPEAPDIQNGDNTFELFDDFTGNSVNAGKWTLCGSGSNTVENGFLNLSTTSGQDIYLEANSAVNGPVIIQSKVQSFNEGKTTFGLINGDDDGYGVTVDFDGLNVALMQRIIGGTCFEQLNTVSSTDAESPVSNSGIWSFSWFGNSSQFFTFAESNPVRYSRTENTYTYSSNLTPIIGQTNAGSGASAQIDWVAVRKYVATDLSASLGSETVLINEVNASADPVTCAGESLQLNAVALPGAVFSWTGPGGFTSNDQNPLVSNPQSGTYTVSVEVPDNCFTTSDDVVVNIDPATVPGTLSGQQTVCAGANSGTLSLSGQVGNIIRWESSPTGTDPWNSISFTQANLPFTNLVNTTWYRAIVKSGSCDEAASNVQKITVDQSSVPGEVLGATTVCIDGSSSVLRLDNYQGSILRWESRAQSAGTWSSINTQFDTLLVEDITETTQYRAVTSGGQCGEAFSDPATITVAPLPITQFTNTTVCLGLETEFINQSSIPEGAIASYFWSFDDGNTSTTRSPTHTYDEPGSYDVRLTVTSTFGCTSTVVNQVEIKELPDVNFFTENICEGAPAEFEPDVITDSEFGNRYFWDYGDGANERLTFAENTSHLFTSQGEYTVTLVVEALNDCVDSIAKNITVYPRANLSFNAEEVFEGQQTSFENTSTVIDGILSYQWAFGDGNSSSAENPRHTYAEAGDYTVRLTSTGSFGGCVDTLSQVYTVKSQVNAAFDFEDVCRDVAATFTNNSSTTLGPLTYLWNFGDGTTSTETNPTHQYDLPGSYTVKLTATSEEGSVDVDEQVITIFPEPSAAFVSLSGCDGQVVNFDNQTSIANGQLEYQWFFEAGAESEITNPNHLFSGAGTYDVQLIATSANGCVDSVSRAVTITPIPQVDFTVDTVCLGQASLFTNTTVIDGGVASETLWDFGDGSNSIVENPSKTYQSPGTYQVNLRVTTGDGCQRSITKNVVVLDVPKADFEVSAVCFGETSIFQNTTTAGTNQVSYLWDFGDGSLSTAIAPDHIYSLPGTYEVSGRL